jgi:hypothetical protein
VRVVYVRRQWGVREIALWFWAVLLTDAEYHFLVELTGVLEVLVMCKKVLTLLLLRLLSKLLMPEAFTIPAFVCAVTSI